MKLRNFVIFQGLLFSLTLCILGQTAPNLEGSAATNTSEELAKGTVVEKVNQQSKAEKAGLQEGDVLLNWTAVDARGEIESPFDLRQIEIEQASRGAVRIEGLRGTEKQAWILESDIRVITVRPNLPDSLLSLYREGQELAKAGKPVEAVERWRAAAVEAERGWELGCAAGHR